MSTPLHQLQTFINNLKNLSFRYHGAQRDTKFTIKRRRGLASDSGICVGIVIKTNTRNSIAVDSGLIFLLGLNAGVIYNDHHAKAKTSCYVDK